MRWWAAGGLLSVAVLAGPADQALARWTLLQGGRIGIAGKVLTDVAQLPAGSYQVEMVDWVAVNAVPEDLERMTGLGSLRELRLPGPLWNRNADGGKDLSHLLRFLAPVKSLEKLTFSDHFLDRIRFRDAGLDAIASVAGIKELALRQAEVKGTGLRHFSRLESLDVTLCPIADLQSLTGMKELRRLWAGDTFVTDLAPLAGLTALEDLDLHGTGIDDRSIAHLSGLKKLRRLNLQGTNLSDTAVSTLETLANLESLNLYRTKLSNAGLKRLGTLAKLREIDIRYTRVTAAGVDGFRASVPRARVQFAGGSARSISSAPPPAGRDASLISAWIRSIGGSVESAEGRVSLRGVPLSEAALAAVARMPGVRVLDLEATDLGDGAVAQLAGIPNLVELSLNSTQLSDVGLGQLGELRQLKRLSVDNTFVEGAGFSKWPADAALEQLNALGTPINDSGLADLARLKRLQRLNLAETDVTAAGLNRITGLRLTELNLSAADIGDDAPIDRFPTLRVLSLRDTRISDLIVDRKLRQLQNLQTLDLGRTRVSNAGMDGLSTITGLRDLDLSYADIDDAGFAKMKGLRDLEFLTLDSTNLTDAAATQLSALGKLRILNLYHTLVTADGLAKLRAALPQTRVVWDKESGMPHRRRA